MVALMVLGLVVVLSPAGPAYACSCAAVDVDARADVIVVGTVTEVDDAGIRLAVESVEKGDPATGTRAFEVGRSEASCGYDFRVGNRYRVNATDGATGLCTGIKPLAAVPSPAADMPSPAEATSVAAAPAPEDPSPGRGWLGPGAALALLVAGLVVLGLRRRG